MEEKIIEKEIMEEDKKIRQTFDYKSSKKIIEQMEQYVFSIKLINEQFTGFCCKIPFQGKNKQLPVLITTNLLRGNNWNENKNETLILSKLKVSNEKPNYHYEDNQDFEEDKEIKLLNLKNRLIYSSKNYNTTIIEIKEEDNIKFFLELDDYIIDNIVNNKNKSFFRYNKEMIYIIQYTINKLSISYGYIDKINDSEYFFTYDCYTEYGSSGAPIFRNNNKIIGKHNGMIIGKNKRIKEGALLSYPINEFIKNNYKEILNKNVINSNIIFDDSTENNPIMLDLSRKNIENEELNELNKKSLIKLKELYLNNNKISDINILTKIEIPKLEILNLSSNKISDIGILQNVYFPGLKKLDLYDNNITNIKALIKIRFTKLESLNLGSNKITDIKDLENVNLKQLKYLNLFDNEISDIKVLEKISFDKLETLNLGCNNITDINILEKVNFKELKVLYLHINFISDIKVFEKVKLGKLEFLNLLENNIDVSENDIIFQKLKSRIKYVEINQSKNLFYNKMFTGMILDVSNDILAKLIKFDDTKSYLEDFYSKFNGEIITLINGQDEISYFDLNNLLLSAITYLDNDITISLKNSNNFQNNLNQNLFDEECLLEIFAQPENNDNLIEFINSKKIYTNILNLKNILAKSYSKFLPNFFELFNEYISKPSSISLPLKKLLEAFDKDYIKNKYIIIITDGNSKQNSENLNNIIKLAKKNDITIATYLLSQNANIKKIIYGEFPNHLNQSAKNLFNISSKVSYKNPVASYYIEQNYDFPDDGEGTLYFESNLVEATNSESNDLANNLNEINYKGIEIGIGDIGFNNFIKFKYNFLTKNQIFGTCWANAIAGSIFLANKRILGRKTETFETYREYIIKRACGVGDGGKVSSPNVIKFLEKKNFHVKRVNLSGAKTAIMKGRFIYFVFWLNNKQWDNFSKFCCPRRPGILDEKVLNHECYSNMQSNVSGHAVILIEITKNYYRFLNSWGSNWGENGTFKVTDPEILKPYNEQSNPEYYDIFFYETELSKNEKDYYYQNINYIRYIYSTFGEMSVERIRNRMNIFYQINYPCKICKRRMKKNEFIKKIENGLYKVKCPSCDSFHEPDGELKTALIFEDLMDDGNIDFDINFKEDYNIHIDRAKLHNSIFLKNESDVCSLGSEDLFEKKIDSFFNNSTNCIICMENGKFVASGKNIILIFELLPTIIEGKIKKNEIFYLITRNILNDELLTLCDLKLGNLNLFASGGVDLKIFQINYENYDLILHFRFNNNKNINKIIEINCRNYRNPDVVKKIIVCDKDGYIGIYNVVFKNTNNNINTNNNNNININVEFKFKTRKHNNKPINCILYLPDENLLVSGSYNDKSLYFWEIEENNLREFRHFSDIKYNSIIYNDSLLDIKGNLLVGLENGIMVYRHHNRQITSIEFYNIDEFEGVYSIKSLGNNYFICGRNFGYCSLFLLREKEIRKINIFRNNNLRTSNEIYDSKNDNYFITNICIKKISEIHGYILVSSVDKTLRVYYYHNKDNNFIDNN